MDDLHQPEVLGGLALSESDLMNLHQVTSANLSFIFFGSSGRDVKVITRLDHK
jgi:hypothetical protein